MIEVDGSQPQYGFLLGVSDPEIQAWSLAEVASNRTRVVIPEITSEMHSNLERY